MSRRKTKDSSNRNMSNVLGGLLRSQATIDFHLSASAFTSVSTLVPGYSTIGWD
jgi:hypothetical protein